MHLAKIIISNHEVREAEIVRRHESGARNARLRAQMATGMAAKLQIPKGEGRLKLSAQDLPEIENVIAQGKEYALQNADAANRKNQIFPKDLYRDPDVLNTPLFKLALDPEVIASVSAYMGYVPILATANFWYNPNDTITDGTQEGYNTSLYHLDWADNQLVKLFVHCSDITDKNGPLHLLSLDQSMKLRTELDYHYQQKRNESTDTNATDGIYIDDALVETHLGKDVQSTPLTGDEGTAYFADTASCFHYGGRNTELGNPRLMGILLYLRPGALRITSAHNDVPPFEHLSTPSMSVLQRLVLGEVIDEDALK